MRALRNFTRSVAPLLCGMLLLSACGNDKDDDNTAAGDGTVTWTHNGQTYTSTTFSSAIVDGTNKLLITGSSADMKNTVSLGLQGIATKGAGTYDLRKGSVVDDLPVGALTLTSGNTGSTYNSLYGPAASNGTITVTQYDKAGQKISGTFSFTAGAVPNTSATGTQAVTNGSFSFTKFQ